MTMTSLSRHHLYLEPSQSVQYFVQQLARVKQQCELREKRTSWVSKRQTLTFHFSTYHSNSFNHLCHQTPIRLHERIDCCDRWNNTATRFRFILVNNIFMSMSKLLHQTCIVGLVKTCHQTLDASQTEWHLHYVLLPVENKYQNAAHYRIRCHI